MPCGRQIKGCRSLRSQTSREDPDPQDHGEVVVNGQCLEKWTSGMVDKSYSELEVWQKSMDLAVNVYAMIKNLPEEEQHVLSDQIRRAVISIPSNIAEGCSRFSDKDTLNFLGIALGSISELETQLIISKNIGYIDNIEELETMNETVKKLLLGLIRYLNNKIEKSE